MANTYWPFIQFMRFSWQVYWGGLPFFTPVDHILSELSSGTCPSWVALHSMAHRFVELWQALSPWPGSEGTRDQITNIRWIIEKAREFQKNIYLCFINYAKAFDCVDHNKLWKALREMGIPDHLTCLLRNLYVGQEATVRTLYGTTDWFKIEKGVWQGCLLSPCLFNLYGEHIMRNARLDELQAGIKIGRRNIYNLKYVDHTALKAASKEELNRWRKRVKELA